MREPERLLSKGASAFERKLLEAVKGECPSVELQARMRHAIGLSWSPTPAATGAAAKGLTAQAPAAIARNSLWLKLGLVVVIAGGVAVSAVLLPSQSGGSKELPAGREQSPPRASKAALGSPPREVVSPAPRGLPAGDATARAPEGRAGEAATLREEIQLLDAARAASSLGDSASSAEALKRYDERFPRGTFQREAAILRSRALEASGAARVPRSRTEPEARPGP